MRQNAASPAKSPDPIILALRRGLADIIPPVGGGVFFAVCYLAGLKGGDWLWAPIAVAGAIIALFGAARLLTRR